MSVKIRNAKILNPNSEFHLKNLHIRIDFSSGKDLFETEPAAAGEPPALFIDDKKVWEASGNDQDLYISPGFVDLFADYREPGYEQKETIETGLKAAVAGGFTDVFLAPNTNPPVSTKSSVQFLLQKSKGSIVNLHPLGTISQQLEGKSLAEMLDMHQNGAIAFSDGWKPVQHAGLMLKALEYVKAFDGILLQIPIDISLSAGGLMHEGAISTRLGMAGIPELAETIFIHRDIELLRYTGSKLHISGVSTAEGLAMIRRAKQEGLPVTCSVTPYHLALTDGALQTYDSLYKVSPVLRSEKDRRALIEGLKDGTIDCIASHHRPQEWDAKAREFEYAGDGMNIQEMAFNIVLESVKEVLSAEQITLLFSIRPREIFGLPSEDFKSRNLNCTIFTTGDSRIFSEPEIKSFSRNNPFIGKEMKGRILGIINNQQFHFNK